MSNDYPNAIGMFVNPEWVFTDTNSHAYIVIHKTAGFETVQELGQYFQDGAPQANGTYAYTSSHFGVGLDGSVAQFVLLKDGAGANCCGENAYRYGGGNLNTVTIAVEHIDSTSDNSTTPTTDQLDASFNLVRYLCKKYSIPAINILRHADIDPVNRANCPGNYPMDLLRKFINMPEEVDTTNQAIVEIWNDSASIFGALDKVPLRDTGIFDAWRDDLIKGKYRGIPITSEQHGIDFNNHAIVRQQFTGSMAWWYEDASLNDGNHILWSDIT